jgi:hypothetical protein
VFVQGVEAIVEAQKRVAEDYFFDGSVDQACPPLRALLYIMAKSNFDGKGPDHPDIRALFSRDNLLKSGWYKARLVTQQKKDIALWRRHVERLESSLTFFPTRDFPRLAVEKKLAHARKMVEDVQTPAYLSSLVGTLGLDPATQ